MTMTKNDLIDILYEQAGLSKKDCSSAVEATFDIIKSQLESGHDVKIAGFGKWSVRSKKDRIGRNPQTKEQITLAARKVVTFKSSTKLKDKLND